MSVLIKGMEMPRCCEECLAESVEENYYGDVMSTKCPFVYKGYTRKTGRLEDCPLVEIPTPHGRLIDADALMEKMIAYGWEHPDSTVHEFLEDDAPTIIEAEGTE